MNIKIQEPYTKSNGHTEGKKLDNSKGISRLKSKKVVWVIAAANLCVTIAMGINIVLFPVILKENHIPEFFIGFSAVIDLSAGLLIAPYLNRITNKISAIYLTTFLLFLYSILVLLIPFFINYIIWLFYMVIFGLFWFCFFTLGNTILNQYIDDKNRSLLISINTTIICVGITIGSSIVKLLGTNNYALWVICATLTLFTAIMFAISLSNIKVKISSTINQKISYYLKKRPDIFLGKFFQEYITTTVFVFMVIYGMNNGFSAENAALIVSFYTLSTIFDILIGYLSDKANRPLKHLKPIIFISTLLMFFIYIFASKYYLMLLLIFLLGISAGYVYINCNSELNSYFPKEDLVAANSCYSMSGNLGGILASLITGLLLQNLGNIGIFLPILIISSFFLFVKTTH